MDHGADPSTSLTHLNRRLLQRILAPEVSEGAALGAIVDCALEAGPDADACGLMLRRRRGRLESAAATSPEVEELQEREIELDEGPAILVTHGEATVAVPDLRAEDRWARWSRAATEAGLLSVLTVRLTSNDGVLGALTWYSSTPHALGPAALAEADTFAHLASAAAETAQTIGGLRQAVRSRHLIGMAQGILMQRYDMGEDAAFDVLRRYSSHDNVKLRDVATRVIDERDLPGGASHTTV